MGVDKRLNAYKLNRIKQQMNCSFLNGEMFDFLNGIPKTV